MFRRILAQRLNHNHKELQATRGNGLVGPAKLVVHRVKFQALIRVVKALLNGSFLSSTLFSRLLNSIGNITITAISSRSHLVES